jgi:hypothetical protein
LFHGCVAEANFDKKYQQVGLVVRRLEIAQLWENVKMKPISLSTIGPAVQIVSKCENVRQHMIKLGAQANRLAKKKHKKNPPNPPQDNNPKTE